jgi:hypothetical protein
VRQYYLRAGGSQGDLQVNLVDKHRRSDKSHAIAQRLRPALEKIGARHGARVKVVEVPPGPPVLSRWWPRSTAPTKPGRQQWPRVLPRPLATDDIVGIDTSAGLRTRRART